MHIGVCSLTTLLPLPPSPCCMHTLKTHPLHNTHSLLAFKISYSTRAVLWDLMWQVGRDCFHIHCGIGNKITLAWPSAEQNKSCGGDPALALSISVITKTPTHDPGLDPRVGIIPVEWVSSFPFSQNLWRWENKSTNLGNLSVPYFNPRLLLLSQ